MTLDGSRSLPVQSEARSLLIKAMATGRVDVERLATELVVTERTIARYLAGEIAIPVERQLCIAHFLIDNVPELGRRGRNLVGKVQAQIRYRNTDTVTHGQMPASRMRSY